MFDHKPSKAASAIPAPLTGWLRLLPAALYPYARLMRLDKPIGWWLLLLPCWWSVLLAGPGALMLEFQGWYYLFLFFIGAIAMRSAGCIVNDFWDRPFDGQVARTASRPLVSGEVSLLGAAICFMLCAFVGALVFVQLSGVAMILAALSMVLVIIYPLFKRVTWWPQAILGFTFNIGALVGAAAMLGQVDAFAGVLYIAGISWTLGYDTVYAYQDREDDTKLGLKSTALLFGKWGKLAVGGFYTVTTLGLAYALWLASPMAYAPWLAAPIGVMFLIQIITWSPDDPASCWQAFRHNRDIGLLITLACAVCFTPYGP